MTTRRTFSALALSVIAFALAGCAARAIESPVIYYRTDRAIDTDETQVWKRFSGERALTKCGDPKVSHGAVVA